MALREKKTKITKSSKKEHTFKSIEEKGTEWCDIKKDKDGTEYIYPHVHMKHSPVLKFRKDSYANLEEALEKIREELKTLPGSPYELDIDMSASYHTYVLSKREDFERNYNPIIMCNALTFASTEGVYPPRWAYRHVAQIFAEFFSEGGVQDLEKLFGFKRSNGREPVIQEYMHDWRDEVLCFDVFCFNTLFGVPVRDACFLVECRLEENPPEYDMGLKLRNIKQDTIYDKYKRKWHKKFVNTVEYHKKILRWTTAQKLQFLKRFSEHIDVNTNKYPEINKYLKKILPVEVEG